MELLSMKVYYFNDEKVPVHIKVQSVPTGEGPTYNDNIKYNLLEPQEGRMFEMTVPEGSIPYIKRWENRIVLISYLPAESIPQLEKESV
jgi:hypothetical protein